MTAAVCFYFAQLHYTRKIIAVTAMIGLPPLSATAKSSDSSTSKWDKIGWRIERKYDSQVLIHNWFEEKVQQSPEEVAAQRRPITTVEYPWYQTKPHILRRKPSRYPNKDRAKEQLFGHHGNMHDNHMITLYDENYCQRPRPASQLLPALRSWDGRNLCWAPEKSDHPIQGIPTNWGLKTKVFEKHAKDMAEMRQTKYETSYSREFQPNLNVPVEGRLAKPRIYKPVSVQ